MKLPRISKLLIVSFLCGYFCDVTKGSHEKCGQDQECAIRQFTCNTGGCINIRYFCDGVEDCPDGSDEIPDTGPHSCGNVLNNSTYKCTLPQQYFCDSIHHCDDKIDENDQLCEDKERYQMKCNAFGHCVNKLFINCSNRPDWTCSDKIMCQGGVCSRRGNMKEEHEAGRIIDQSEECEELPIFSCNSEECLTAEKFCDGKVDCPDGSDEIIANSTNINEGIPCSNKWNSVTKRCVLPKRYECDKIDHCDDRIDECQPGCGNSFMCSNGKCINRAFPLTCDGRDDCGDSSDECEAGCMDGHNVFTCNDGTCLAIELFCDGRVHCPDGSDEFPRGRGNSNVTCANKSNQVSLECVLPRHHVCDGGIHCVTGDDELECDNTRWYKCDNNHLVDSVVEVCDFKDDCCDSSDECGATDCNKTFTCPKSGKCIAFGKFCDGVDDCGDGSDEITVNITGLLCDNNHNDVSKACDLPKKYQCDGLNHCKNRVDECRPGCEKSYFCNSGQCLPRNKLCDGKKDCSDGSDEMTSVPGFKCAVKQQFDDVIRSCVMPQTLLFDSKSDCRDRSDACSTTGTCFRCLTQTFYIASQQVCDGIIDCPDFSDECTCSNQSARIRKICDNYCFVGGSKSCSGCDAGNVACDNATRCIEKKNVCDGTIQCLDGSDENVCIRQDQISGESSKGAHNHKCLSHDPNDVKLATACDGVLECMYLDDECQVVKEALELKRNRSRDRREQETRFVCGEKTLEICKKIYDPIVGWYHCPGRRHQTLYYDNICDGEEDCIREDANSFSMDEQGCDERVTCQSSRPIDRMKVTIHKSQLCDFRIDCEGEEDEAEELCQSKGLPRFYCENRISVDGEKMGEKFVPTQAVMDGKNDCWDGSDECPTRMFKENTFSSRHRMIRNVILSVMVWIMGILALFGNSVVMWHSIRKLRSARRFSPLMRSNYILVFNLASADFLMGVYLIALAIQNAATDGSYCKVDLAWRSGSTCAALGSLALVSIQSSVFFLVLLTTYRVVTVLRPFRANSLRVRYTVALVICAWFLAIILATVPRLPQFKEYFVSGVWVSPGVSFFNTNTPTIREIGKFADVLSSYMNGTENGSVSSWNAIYPAIENYYPNDWPTLEILGEFGYYSAHSVCLPRFFVKVYDSAWAYSVTIMTFDLASFLYIAMSYRMIYHDAQRSGALRNGNDAVDENKTLQTRITRLVLTDFFCLVPVCMTAFLSIVGVEINPIAYAVAAIVLLPINSAINPIIYSNVLSVIYSTCVTPATACVTKGIMTQQKNKRTKTAGADRRHVPQRHNGYNYKLCRGSNATSNDENMKIERMRLGSDFSSSNTTKNFNVSVDTTNSKV